MGRGLIVYCGTVYRGDLIGKIICICFQAAFKGCLKCNEYQLISATDMTLGTRLDFLQEYFDVLCVDLTDMPVSRAVAASSAVPMVFSPLTLNNHGGQCGYHLPPELIVTAYGCG